MANAKGTITSSEVKEFARQTGVDCVGIVRVEDVPPSFPARPPQDALAGAKSLVVYGLGMLDGCFDANKEAMKAIQVNLVMGELNRISYRVGRFIEGRGFRAGVIPAGFPFELSRESRGFVGDVSLKHAAVGAGLGVRGLSGLVINPEWGPRIRFGAVITNAVLEPDQPLTEDICCDCSVCAAACPVGAIADDGKLDLIKCARRYQPYGMSRFLKLLNDFIPKTAEEKKKALSDPVLWNIYNAVNMFGYCACFECVRSCPVGR